MITSKQIIESLHQILEANELIDLRSDKAKNQITAFLYKNCLVVKDKIFDTFSDYDVFDHNLFKDELLKKIGVQNFSSDNIKYMIILDIKKKNYKFPTDTHASMGGPKFSGAKITGDQQDINRVIKELQRFNIISGNFKFVGDKITFAPNKFGRNILYHGTNSIHTEQILKVGLMPSIDGNGSPLRGNASTINKWTQNFVYLTPSLTLAKMYADKQSSSGSSPIVLAVEVPDSNKLFIDDQYLIDSLIISLNDEIKKVVVKVQTDKKNWLKNLDLGPWSKLPVLYTVGKGDVGWIFTNYILDIVLGKSVFDVGGTSEFRKDYDSYNKWFHEEGLEYLSWNEYVNFIHWVENKIRIIYPKLVNSSWKNSAFKIDQAVGYKGRIPPKFISIAWQK